MILYRKIIALQKTSKKMFQGIMQNILYSHLENAGFAVPFGIELVTYVHSHKYLF